MHPQTPRPKHFQGFLTQGKAYLPEKNHKKVTKTVHINQSDIASMVDLYRWRAETQFPIAKINTIDLLHSEPQPKNTR